jgi:hypothetical protein
VVVTGCKKSVLWYLRIQNGCLTLFDSHPDSSSIDIFHRMVKFLKIIRLIRILGQSLKLKNGKILTLENKPF